MKLRFISPLALGVLLALAGCGLVTPLPSSTYAELRLGEDGKKQLLIETDQWRGAVTAEGYQGNWHRVVCWLYLEGDGPVYVVDEMVGAAHNVGKITIDTSPNLVTIDLRLAEKIEGKQPPFPSNGTYRLASINHDPFYVSGHQP